MCGIIFAVSKDEEQTKKMVRKQYNTQYWRGHEGFGVISLTLGQINIGRSAIEKNILKDLKRFQGNVILFHHRFPTSGPNVKEMAHPITVESDNLGYNYYVMHNGVITNDDYLKREHEEKGYKYTTQMQTYFVIGNKAYSGESSFNDSEAFAIEIAEVMDEKKTKINTTGAAAFIALQTSKLGVPIAVYYGRNAGNPLKVQRDGSSLLVASEAVGENIEVDRLFRYDCKTGKITVRNIDMGYCWKESSFNSSLPSKQTSLLPAKTFFENKKHAGFRDDSLKSDGFTYAELLKEKHFLQDELKVAKELGDKEEITRIELELQYYKEQIRLTFDLSTP